MLNSYGTSFVRVLRNGAERAVRGRIWPALTIGFCLFPVLFGVGSVFAANPSGDLRIEIMSAYNFVVDSNVESPSTYAPRSAYLGAKIYNDGTNDLTDVYAYIGNFTNSTPGIYPARTHMTLAAPPGGFSLIHEGGSAGTMDATRYMGTIPAGGYVAVYWLVSYPNLDVNGDAVWGPSVKPDDDLWLEYYVWATANDAGSPAAADVKRTITMRNEISAAANKIFPNGANKVPDAYKALLEKYDPAWTNMYSDGTPGTRIWTEGIWYDLGNVGAGFDNDGDLVPDKNAWMQPVGDPTIFDAASFRLVRTYAMVVVKLKGGGEQVYNVEDQLYFQNIPENNGAVGLVRYEFLPLKSGSSSALTPYQEVASGFDNEKFNGDYGASIGSGISSGASKVEIDKAGNVTVTPGGTIDYQISFTNSGFVKVGDPRLNTPLVLVDVIPDGTTYVAGSATGSNVLPVGVGSYTVLFSTNNGTTWTDVEPGSVADITDVQWWLDAAFDTNAFGSIGFSVDVDNPYTNSLPYIENEGGGTFGGGPPFTNSTVITKVSGTNEIGDMVFFDDGAGTGTLGNGVKDGTEAGLPNITVTLYFDSNANDVLDASDILMGTDVTDGSGGYLFEQLGDGKYIVVVDAEDPDLPFGTAVTRPTAVAVELDVPGTNGLQVSYLDADFSFAPVLALDKSIVGGVATNREGSTITYRLMVTNNLAGTGGLQVYDVWAEGADVSAKPWEFPENVYSPPGPDGIYSTNALEAATEKLLLTDFQLGVSAGSISNVKVVVAMDVTGTFNGDDLVVVSVVQRGGPTFFTTNVIANLLVTNIPSMIVNGELVLETTTNRVWQWSDFNGTNLIIQLDAKKAGGPNAGAVLVDAVGFRVTSDWVAGAVNPSLSLDPIPLKDTFDADILRYVSSDLAPSSVATNGSAPNSVGTISWNNVGPLYEGGFQTIDVKFKVLEPPSNTSTVTTNMASITNAYYGDGRPANTVTDKVASVILPAGTIGDFVWRDLDADGVQDGGSEVGIAGVAVRLTPPIGVNLGNGAGNPITNITDSTGYYLFEGIPADGSYTVTIVTTTLPGGSGTATYDADGGLDSTSVVLMNYDASDGSDTSLTNDFGYMVLSSIDGTVWHDLNRNGATSPDSGEQWLKTVMVYLYAGTVPGTPATAIATNYTDASGYFRFIGNYAGNYTVQVWTNTGDMASGTWIQSFDTNGTGTKNYVPLNVVTGGTARADFSYYKSGTYQIGDRVFYDWDGDGLLTAADEGMKNITVYLYEDQDGDGVVDVGVDALISSQVTGVGGNYLFTGLPSTNYIVIVDQTDPDFPARYINTADPYGVNDGRSKLTLIASRLDQDFGYQPLGNGSIGDTVWYDANGDGLQAGPRETGLANVTVSLKADFNGDGTYVTIATTVTDAAGHYLFEDLPDGNYIARVDETDADIPLDSFGTRYVPTTSVGFNVTITDSSSYLNADFGFTALGAIGDTIFWDANKNGTQDYNEDGIAGVTVRLYKDVNGDGYYTAGTDTLYDTRVTDVNGNYLFTGLSIGKYVVDVVQSGPIATAAIMADPSADGLPATDPLAVDVDGEYGVSIYAGTSFMGADFGYVPPGVLGDTLWLDTDSDGSLDDGETGIPYITIELWSNGVLVATNETDSSGQYLFQNLSDGTYTVIVATNDSDWISVLGQTYDPDGVKDNQGSGIIVLNGVVVSIGGSPVTNADLDIDFGYRYTGTNSLSGTVGLESNPIDGVIGSGSSGYTVSNEVPYSDVSLYLYLWNDDGNSIVEPGESKLISSTLTTTNGDYLFTNLPEGDGNDNYIVSLFAPEDNLVLTTTNGLTPATKVVNTMDPAGNIVSAYQIVLVAPVITDMDFAFKSRIAWDFGDLPSVYGTQIQDLPSGPRHRVKVVPDLYLGASVDAEQNGQPAAGADGDGADEDGVEQLGVWQNGGNGQVHVQVGKGSGWVVGFIDFNGDGDFTDYGEMVFSQAASTNGGGGTGIYTNTFTVSTNVMSGTNTTSLYARFRLFEKEPGFPEFASIGKSDNGEVEDYLWKFGALGDYVWRDRDADGVQDALELPVTNARVFIDLNVDGMYQAGEPNDFTDTNGFYYIGGFCPGTYSVLVDTNTISSYIWPSYDLDGTGTAHRATVVITTNGQVMSNVDFGYQTLVLGGMVWLDSSRNGTQDEGPVIGVTNVTVHLLDDQTNLLATAFTDADGRYLFDIDMPGDYLVQFFPINYEISPKDFGGNDAIDSDVWTSSPYRTELITLASAERQTNWDLGVYLPDVTNSIGDRVWFDYDRDGVQDAGEIGIKDLTVTLYDSATNVVETTTTDITGNYYFAGVPEASYFIGFSKPANYLFSSKDQGGNDSLDSDADTTTGYSPAYFMTNGFLNHTIDAGIYGVVDLGVTKEVDDSVPNVGDIIKFTVTVSNAGPAVATQVQLKDTWPTNIVYLGADSSKGTYAASSNFWNVGGLAVAQFETLVLTGRVAVGTGGKTFTNVINIIHSFEPDLNPANNSDKAVVVVESVDVGVTKVVDDATPFEGSNIVYTIVVTNNGPSVATGVRVTDLLPDWLSFSSYIASSGTYTSVTGVWDIGTIAVSNSETLAITANVDAGAGGRTITNTSTITAVDQEDQNPANNTDNALIVVVGADLVLDKTVDNPGPNENDTIFYTITIENNGPNVPTNIVVYEPLKEGLNYVGHLVSAGTYSTNDWKWNIPTLAVSDSETLTIECTVGGGTKFTYITNISTIVTSSLPDPNILNNSATQIIGVADVRIKKTSSLGTNGWAYPGSNITYTIVTTNQGVPPHENVSITDQLPGGVSYVSSSSYITKPFYTNANVKDSFNVIAYTNNNGTLRWANNWAEIGEVTSVSAGDVRVLDDTAVGSQYVLSIENGPKGAWRQANLSAWRWGELRFSYRRNGMDNDTNDYVAVSISANGGVDWVVLDTIVGTGVNDPAYVSRGHDISAYLSSNTAVRFVGGPSLDNNDYLYVDNVELVVSQRVYRTVSNTPPPNFTTNMLLLEDEYCIITYDVTVDNEPAYLWITNIAKVTTSLMPVPRSSKVVNPLYYVDLGVTKEVNSDSLLGTNEVIWYTIDLTNSGPGNATGIVLTDYWPPNVIFSNAVFSIGYYNPTNHTWGGFTLNAHETASLVITGQVDNVPLDVVITNIIAVTSLDQFDPNPENDSDDADFDTLVVLQRFEAFLDGGDVIIEWETAGEYGTEGFYIYRVLPDGKQELVNIGIVPAVAGAPLGGVYCLRDKDGKPGRSAEYLLVEQETGRKRTYYGPFKVTPKPRPGPAKTLGPSGYCSMVKEDPVAKARGSKRRDALANKVSSGRGALKKKTADYNSRKDIRGISAGGLTVEVPDGEQLDLEAMRNLEKVWRTILRAWRKPDFVDGEAIFLIQIGSDGKITSRSMVISSGDVRVNGSAYQALSQVRFISGLPNGFTARFNELKVTFGN